MDEMKLKAYFAPKPEMEVASKHGAVCALTVCHVPHGDETLYTRTTAAFVIKLLRSVSKTVAINT